MLQCFLYTYVVTLILKSIGCKNPSVRAYICTGVKISFMSINLKIASLWSSGHPTYNILVLIVKFIVLIAVDFISFRSNDVQYRTFRDIYLTRVCRLRSRQAGLVCLVYQTTSVKVLTFFFSFSSFVSGRNVSKRNDTTQPAIIKKTNNF
jgi:hypothetical protein